ncbi:hypothetical protein T484DRAFT_1919840 [Baffinella frigidus]|nr:hypothetical protein T484DRAFT_1919840 [Cryptophyta sp. CCMP2293]
MGPGGELAMGNRQDRHGRRRREVLNGHERSVLTLSLSCALDSASPRPPYEAASPLSRRPSSRPLFPMLKGILLLSALGGVVRTEILAPSTRPPPLSRLRSGLVLRGECAAQRGGLAPELLRLRGGAAATEDVEESSGEVLSTESGGGDATFPVPGAASGEGRGDEGRREEGRQGEGTREEGTGKGGAARGDSGGSQQLAQGLALPHSG